MRSETLQGVFESRHRSMCVCVCETIDTLINRRSINVHVNEMNDGVVKRSALVKKRALSPFNFSNRASAKRHQFYLHATRGEKRNLRRMGLPYARENIINQTRRV